MSKLYEFIKLIINFRTIYIYIYIMYLDEDNVKFALYKMCYDNFY